MIRCLLLMHSHGGGAEQLAVRLAHELDKTRFAVTIACLRHLPAVETALPTGVQLLMPNTPTLHAALRNVATIRKHCTQSDVVVGTLELQSLLAAALLAPRGRALGWLHKDISAYLAQHDRSYGHLYRYLLGIAASRCKHVICVSNGVRASLAAAVPDHQASYRTLWNPVDLAHVQRMSQEPLPVALAPYFQQPVLLGVGRLVQQKAFHTLIAAHALLRQRGGQQVLCIAGEGPERPFLEAEAKRLSVADSTLLPGFVNPWPLMRHARALGASSVFEGAPLVLVEALALGLPVVSTDCPSGPAEILNGGTYGTLVPVGSPLALANALHPLLDGPHQRDPARIAAGQARAQEFSMLNTMGAWTQLLTQCATASRHS